MYQSPYVCMCTYIWVYLLCVFHVHASMHVCSMCTHVRVCPEVCVCVMSVVCGHVLASVRVRCICMHTCDGVVCTCCAHTPRPAQEGRGRYWR